MIDHLFFFNLSGDNFHIGCIKFHHGYLIYAKTMYLFDLGSDSKSQSSVKKNVIARE